jgi:GxxExxY protein
LDPNDIGSAVVESALAVHTALGPGLRESAYEVCLAHELGKRGRKVERQVAVPINYDGVRLEAGYRIDLLVSDAVIVELKSVDTLAPIHVAQLLSYLKLSGLNLGYLLNSNVVHMRHGIKRVVNRL